MVFCFRQMSIILHLAMSTPKILCFIRLGHPNVKLRGPLSLYHLQNVVVKGVAHGAIVK